MLLIVLIKHLDLIGAESVYTGSLSYARLSSESIMRLDPDVIIDLIPDLGTSRKLNHKQVQREWNELENVSAVKNGEVHVFDDDYVCIPGPRFILLLENIARAVYPDHLKEKS